MLRQVLCSMIVGVALTVAAQPAAQAAAAPRTEQLKLRSFTVEIDTGDSSVGHCDASRAGACAYLTIKTVFTGLSNFVRPDETLYSAGNLGGPIEVTRTYGCEDARGKRLHRYDTKVSTTEGLTNYRGGGITIPATGDIITQYNYVFLDDRLPTDCPTGTTPRLYKITAGKARLSLEFRVPGFPDGIYKASDRASWTAEA
jgi:hypothetical protein